MTSDAQRQMSILNLVLRLKEVPHLLSHFPVSHH